MQTNRITTALPKIRPKRVDQKPPQEIIHPPVVVVSCSLEFNTWDCDWVKDKQQQQQQHHLESKEHVLGLVEACGLLGYKGHRGQSIEYVVLTNLAFVDSAVHYYFVVMTDQEKEKIRNTGGFLSHLIKKSWARRQTKTDLVTEAVPNGYAKYFGSGKNRVFNDPSNPYGLVK